MKVSKLSKQHLTERFKWLNNIHIYSNMNMQYPITYEETEKWYDRVLLNSKRMDFVFEENNKIVAMTGLTNLDLDNGLIEFYIMVNPDCQRKGYGKKATEFTINYAFLNFNVHKIYLYTNDFNLGANQLYEILGFEKEGRLRKHKFKDGRYIDRYIYGLLKEEWNKKEYSKSKIELEF